LFFQQFCFHLLLLPFAHILILFFIHTERTREYSTEILPLMPEICKLILSLNLPAFSCLAVMSLNAAWKVVAILASYNYRKATDYIQFDYNSNESCNSSEAMAAEPGRYKESRTRANKYETYLVPNHSISVGMDPIYTAQP